MKTWLRLRWCVILGFAAVFHIAAAGAQTDASEADDDAPATAWSAAWPRQFKHGDESFTIYQPQLDRWQGDRLEGRSAVAVQTSGSDKPVFGVISLSARTDANGDSVTVHDFKAGRASFPTDTLHAGRYLEAVREQLEGTTWNVSAERLRADLAIDQAARQSQAEPVKNDPPRIVYSQTPAILVPVDGQPVLREMVGLQLSRVLNTRALLLKDQPTGRYYLYVAGRWMDAPALDGPWGDAQVRPSALEEAKQQAVAGGQVDLLDDEKASGGRAQVIVSTVPAELVQTDGPPQYSPIERTQLLYVTNTPNRLFLDLSSQQYYALLSGRWYRTRSLDRGPWDYIAGASLPPEFAMIPDNHPTESVRAAVPGTPQAQEAVIANSVPQVATVKRTAAKLEIIYDGPPQFQPIEGTSLESVVNAPVPVIRVDWHNYYALDNGVWFFSDSPDGPWAAATYVPAVIYTIPRRSPLHYVTYVRVYDAAGDDIYVGYTPGYVGSYVAAGTVVYGTGWYYRPWIGTVWYGPPVTWGFGFSWCGSWWNPWPFWRPAFFAWRPYPRFHPWWGPWHARAIAGPTVVVGVGIRGPGPNRVIVERRGPANVARIYGRWGNRVAVANAPGPRPAALADSQRGPGGAAGAPGRRDWNDRGHRDWQGQRFSGEGERPDGHAARWNGDSGGTRTAGPGAALAGPNVSAPQTASPAPVQSHTPDRIRSWQREGRHDWDNRRPDAGPRVATPPASAAPAQAPDHVRSWQREGRRDWDNRLPDAGPRVATPPASAAPGQAPDRVRSWQRDGRRDWAGPRADAAPSSGGSSIVGQPPSVVQQPPRVNSGSSAAVPTFVPRALPPAGAERPAVPGPTGSRQERNVIDLHPGPARGPAIRPSPSMGAQPGASMGGPQLRAPVRVGDRDRGSGHGGGGWHRRGEGGGMQMR